MTLPLHNSAAFSLIELLVALMVASVLLVLTAPALRHLHAENRAITTADRMVTALQLARYEAIARGQASVFCPRADQKQCGRHWEAGQMIVVDGRVVRVFDALPMGDTLQWRGNLGHADIVFLPSGFTQGQNGSFY